MKKILLAAVILFTATAGTMVPAQSGQENGKAEWIRLHEKGHTFGRHPKRTKPVREVSGTAKWGAKQVSPPPHTGQ